MASHDKVTKPTKPGTPRSSPRSVAGRLPRSVVAAIDEGKVLGIRAGARSDHRFIGVWPIVVEGRVFVRSWTLKPEGWYRTFLVDPLGTIQVGDRRVPVRAVRVKSDRLRDAVERGYAAKYPTPGSQKYVRGFRAPRRREATMELVGRRG
jgi:hypothetical protein